MLHPVSPNRVFEDIVDQLEKAIFEGHLSVGDKLPSERELEKQLKTSRTTIRVALRILEQKGLVEIKTGRQGGAFVSDLSSTDKIGEHFALLIRMGKINLSQLTTFRFAVDSSAFLLAVQKCTEKDVAELKKLLHDMESKLDSEDPEWREFFAIESLMHQKTIVMARNPLFELVLKIVHTSLWKYYSLLPKEKSFLKRIYRDWCDFISAMEKHDVFRADVLIKAHLLDSHRLLIKAMSKKDLDDTEVFKRFYDSHVNGNGA